MISGNMKEKVKEWVGEDGDGGEMRGVGGGEMSGWRSGRGEDTKDDRRNTYFRPPTHSECDISVNLVHTGNPKPAEASGIFLSSLHPSPSPSPLSPTIPHLPPSPSPFLPPLSHHPSPSSLSPSHLCGIS